MFISISNKACHLVKRGVLVGIAFKGHFSLFSIKVFCLFLFIFGMLFVYSYFGVFPLLEGLLFLSFHNVVYFLIKELGELFSTSLRYALVILTTPLLFDFRVSSYFWLCRLWFLMGNEKTKIPLNEHLSTIFDHISLLNHNLLFPFLPKIINPNHPLWIWKP